MSSDAVATPPGKGDSTGSTRRASSLDALRGLAILGMVLSGLLPFWDNTLPAWMYHAQMPPPKHLFNPEIIGMTWVDLVFPLFLFALGAAVPLALSRKLDRPGFSRPRLFLSIAWRGMLLLFFALYKQHLAPGLLRESYGQLAWGIGIVAFIVLFAVFTRLPTRWPSWLRWGIRAAGWAAAFALLASVRYPGGSGFTVHRHDIIIVILANVVVTTSLVWLCWPAGYTGRLCIMAVVLTGHLARRYSPWGLPITELHFLQPLLGERIFNGIFWACAPAYQKYLLITIPGTIAGDVLVTWLRPAAQRLSFSIQNSRWGELSMVRCVCIAIVCLALLIGGIAGLSMNDWLLTLTMSAALGVLGLALLYGPPARRHMRTATNARHQNRRRVSALLFRSLFVWGMIWLLLGLALYPYQGGIRKDPATLSYLFTSAGLAYMALIFLSVITEAMHRSKLLFLLIDNGQNPMIAYIASGMLILPILHLIPIGDGSVMDWLISITASPWLGVARAVGLTLCTALFVSLITRLRIFWRT